MNPDVRIGDVWCSEKSGRLVTVVPASEYRGPADAGDPRDVFYRGVTGAVMSALAANFVRGRRLIERAGVRVGDLAAMPLVIRDGKAVT